MYRNILLLAALTTSACAAPPEESAGSPEEEGVAAASPLEGTFEYVGALRGQSILTGGRYVFLYGPSDESGPLTGEAGLYRISGDTATHTVTYSTDPSRVGLVFRWTQESFSGDTISYVVMDREGTVTGRGRGVRR